MSNPIEWTATETQTHTRTRRRRLAVEEYGPEGRYLVASGPATAADLAAALGAMPTAERAAVLERWVNYYGQSVEHHRAEKDRAWRAVSEAERECAKQRERADQKAAALGRTIEVPRFEVTINGEPLRWTDIPVTARGVALGVALDSVEAGDVAVLGVNVTLPGTVHKVATTVKVPRYPLHPGSRFDGGIIDGDGDRLTLERRNRGVLVVCESPQGGSSRPWLADVLSLAEREGLL